MTRGADQNAKRERAPGESDAANGAGGVGRGEVREESRTSASGADQNGKRQRAPGERDATDGAGGAAQEEVRKESRASTAPPGLIDIPSELSKPFSVWRVAAGVGIGLLAVAVIVPVVIALNMLVPPGLASLATWAAITLVIAGVIVVRMRRATRRTRDLVNAALDAHPLDIRPAAADVARRIVSGDAFASLPAFAKLARERGIVGATIRIAAPPQLTPIRPLDVPFEPAGLSEFDERLGQLRDAADDAGQTGAVAERTPPTLMDQVRRQMRLGYWAAILFALMFVLTGVKALQTGRPNWERLLLWGALLVATLLAPRWTAAQRGQMYLAAPGSLIVRLPSITKRRKGLHLYVRGRSVLCVRQLNRDMWGWAAADGERCDQAMATQPEIEVLLRAWLSPLPPPEVERMSDLA